MKGGLIAMKCDNCKKLAIKNVQDAIIEWDLDKAGNYSDQYRLSDLEIGNGVNKHLCQEHYDDFIENGY